MLQLYGTLGPSCTDETVLRNMFSAGMTGIRVNLSHTNLTDATDALGRIRRAAADCGILPRILIDMNGPELRLGTFPTPVPAERGSVLRFGADGIPVPEVLTEQAEKNLELSLDDGKLSLVIRTVGVRFFEAEILRGGTILPRKSIAVHEKAISAPVLTAADIENLRLAGDCGVTDIMQPFASSSEQLRIVRSTMGACGCPSARLLAKVENADGVAHLDELIDTADEIVIARGDLGNQYSLWEVPALQKSISARCRERGRAFMVVTQLLASMEGQPSPTRAEVSDIFNAVLDGAASLMVTGETAIGRYPAECITYLRKTALEALRFRDTVPAD